MDNPSSRSAEGKDQSKFWYQEDKAILGEKRTISAEQTAQEESKELLCRDEWEGEDRYPSPRP